MQFFCSFKQSFSKALAFIRYQLDIVFLEIKPHNLFLLSVVPKLLFQSVFINFWYNALYNVLS